MTAFIRRFVALLGVAVALSGCVVYPVGYRYPRPAVAVVAPCCAYGYGYRRWY